MKRYKWKTQLSSDWTVYTMRSFIVDQNTYSYDGEEPIVHSLDTLMKFADISGKKAEQFAKEYKKLYPTKTLS